MSFGTFSNGPAEQLSFHGILEQSQLVDLGDGRSVGVSDGEHETLGVVVQVLSKLTSDELDTLSTQIEGTGGLVH